ncbi:MAG TPA: T9SS type A sorting domain-containing protein [Flavobacteriales bacterium]|nr:T9SS type A sorting domain-containing protein [Flavobacteriales bacterium]
MAALAACHVCGQFSLPVKEQYDYATHKLLFNGTYAGVVAYIVDNPDNRPWSGYKYGGDVGNILEGYLRLYETTGDKSYLIRFINLCLKAMAWRNYDYSFTDSSLGDDESPYMNGVLLWPMAHFVHLILAEEDDLSEQIIPGTLIINQSSNISVNELPGSSTYTYGSIATWLMYRCVESLDAIIAEHWNDNSAFCYGKSICAVNMQAGFAGALLYLGHLGNVNSSYSGLLSYLDKAAVLARMFSGYEPEDRCHCIAGGDEVLIPFYNNSFWWHHNALSYIPNNCLYFCLSGTYWVNDEPDLEGLHEFVEDISHGVIDLVIPTLSERFGLYTNGAYPFMESDLVRFRNAFTKHIAQWNGTGWQFKNAVDGSNGPVYYCDTCTNYPPVNTFAYASLGWMPMHVYDESIGAASGLGVYDILSHFYEDVVYPTPTHISGGLYHYGVAEVVAAQWERECFSLDLYNRKLVYDQDFAAKNVLRVFPAGEAGASFADPVIHEPRFTVNENIRSEFRAGSAVIFEPGFEAVRGSVVEAVIDPLGCDLAYKANMPIEYPRTEVRAPEAREQTIMEQDAPVSLEQTTERQKMDAFRLVPNPTSGETNAELHLIDQRSASLSIHDALGRQVWSGRFGTLVAGEHRRPVGIRLPAGVYHCTLSLDGVQHTQRLVVE